MLKLYSTLSRKKEVFKPLKEKEVSMYSCGPTVYWNQHIGNMYMYTFVDVLKRALVYNGYNVKHIINITDVGHLTSDAEEGEDKMVKAIKREKLPLNKDSMLIIADKYTKIWQDDLKKLNIIFPYKFPKATEHIKEMIDVIKKIEKNGFTYKTDVGLIFDTSKFKDYAKLGRLNQEQLKQGARTEKDPQRKNPSDFALWITNQPNHIMQWDSPWGRGFPGWHIECSAMSSKYLGEQFDIHTGGEEHIAVHHTNEIAQSEAAFGKHPWVKYWVHLRWLLVKGKKMSKSKGELYTISELEEKGYPPMDFRYLCLLTHYRKNLDFSLDSLDAAKAAYQGIKNKIKEIDKDSKGENGKKYLDEFEKAMDDDLNTPQAIQALQGLLKDKKVSGKAKLEIIKKIDSVLGLDLLKAEKIDVPEDVKKLVDEREEARKSKDWKKADELRDKINKLGFVIDDTEDGSIIEKR